MFDVDEAVGRWRESIAASESVSGADVEEMHGHLVEEMAALGRCGLSEEEAFVIGVRRIGEPGAVAAEFAKVNGGLVWRQRFFWMVMGVFVFVAVSAGAALVGGFATIGGVLAGARGAWVGAIGYAAQAAVIAAGILLIAKGISRDRLERLVNSDVSGVAILVIAGLAVVFRTAVRMVPYVTYRLLSAKDAGATALGWQAMMFGWTILMPIITAVILLVLQAKRQEIAGNM